VDAVSPLELAQRIYKSRRERRHFFPQDLFADPAWDMLLALYTSELEGSAVSVSSLSIAADVPVTTGLRWLHALEKREFISRRAHPRDKRSFTIHLSAETRAALTAYLERTSGKYFRA
jgi:DNA-binding MarR family transcriptional regulator